MKRLHCFLICVCLGMSTIAFAQAGPHPFIGKPAGDPNALARQVASNPVYMDRYVRHFQLKPSEVVAFIKSLRLSTLDRDTTVEMFNVPAETGVIRSRKMVLKKGTKVWVDSSGKPILKASCGNPLERTDKAAEPALNPQISVSVEEKPIAVPGQVGAVPGAAFAPIEPMAPVAPDVQFQVPPTITQIVSKGTQTSGFTPFGLPFIPTILIGFRGHDHRNVPEPSTVFLIAGGFGMLAARARAKRRFR